MPPGGGAPALPAACGEDLDPKEERTAWQEEPRKLEECGRALQWEDFKNFSTED